MQLSNFLRTILKLDAASCLGLAVLVIPAAAVLEAPFGVAAAVLTASAAALIPIGLFIGWLGTRREAPALLVWLVIAGNLGWTAASLVAAGSITGITALGQAAIAGQGLAVLVVALAEWAGLRSSQQAAPRGA